MRDYTRLTATLLPEEAVQLLNGYFDCLVPPIEAEGGEVLKYMGDGLLAIFREGEDDQDRAAQAALTAAVQALDELKAANGAGLFPSRISAGLALHRGEVAYGNVGSGARLNFTVIGPDVNLASRIAQLNKVLGEPLLLSQAFVDVLPGRSEPLGAHAVDGFAQAGPISRPAQREGQELFAAFREGWRAGRWCSSLPTMKVGSLRLSATGIRFSGGRGLIGRVPQILPLPSGTAARKAPR